MDKYTIIYTPNFEIQLYEIINYISYQLYNPQAASHFLDILEIKTKNLISFPCIYPIVKENPWNNRGLRKMTINAFVIYYLADDIDKSVYLLSIIYARRDQLAQLNKLDF